MKKLKSVLVIALVVMMAFVSCTKDEESSDSAGTRSAASNKNINIATASVGGAYYAVGQEIANLVNKYADGLTMAPEVTAGAVENPRLVDQGDADFGITNANFAYAGVRGEDPYQKVLNISSLANMHPSVFHIITLEGSNIHSIADLKGAKIAVGPAGGGTMPILENVLSLYGLSVDDITPSYLSYDDGFTQLSDGNVDVAGLQGRYQTVKGEVPHFHVKAFGLADRTNDVNVVANILARLGILRTKRRISRVHADNQRVLRMLVCPGRNYRQRSCGRHDG